MFKSSFHLNACRLPMGRPAASLNALMSRNSHAKKERKKDMHVSIAKLMMMTDWNENETVHTQMQV